MDSQINGGISLYGEKWGEYSILYILKNEKNEGKREKMIIELITKSKIPLHVVIIGCMAFWTRNINIALSLFEQSNLVKERLDKKFFNDTSRVTSIVKCCFLCNKMMIYNWLNSYYQANFLNGNLLLLCTRNDKWLDDIEIMEKKNPDLLPSINYFTTIKNSYLI
jgi:hypothetical protein